MPSTYARILDSLAEKPRRWLVTGCAGFVGSHLLAKLLECGQQVTGLDDFSTGRAANLDAVRLQVGEDAWKRFRWFEGDIRDSSICQNACHGAELVLHQAAMISVPLSFREPDRCESINVNGFRTLLAVARDCGAQRVVYASSSAVYGDSREMPLREDSPMVPTSPYGSSKLAGELHAQAFTAETGIPTVGLRYFNIFGERQSPEGGYAAVIPTWIAASLRGQPCQINGDGNHTRDFCHVADVVQANILAAVNPARGSGVFNVGLGACMSLNELSSIIVSQVQALHPHPALPAPIHAPPRPGDIIHSQADISKIRSQLGFKPSVTVREGIERMLRLNEGNTD